MAQASQALTIDTPRAPLKVVWMYQHPSNRPLYKHYGKEHTAILEEAWQRFHNYEGPNYIEIQIPDDNGSTVPALVHFCDPMTQYSPAHRIYRAVKRYLEEDPVPPVWLPQPAN